MSGSVNGRVLSAFAPTMVAAIESAAIARDFRMLIFSLPSFLDIQFELLVGLPSAIFCKSQSCHLLSSISHLRFAIALGFRWAIDNAAVQLLFRRDRPDLHALTDQQLQDIFKIGRDQADSPQLIERGSEEHPRVLYIWFAMIAAGIGAVIGAVKAVPFVRRQLRTSAVPVQMKDQS